MISTEFICKCGMVGWIAEGEEKQCPTCKTNYFGVYDKKNFTIKALVKKPEWPVWPVGALIKESDDGSKLCKKCGSSLKTKFIVFKTNKCIQPECENYWRNNAIY